MASVTTFDDVSSAQKRPIPSEDQTWVEAKIREAEAILSLKRPPSIEDWAAEQDSDNRRANIKFAVIRMVTRVLKNPDGLTAEADGDYSYGRDKSLASGEIYASRADLLLIGIKSTRRARKAIRLTLPPDSPRNMRVG
jgi:hypothetical protein